MEGRGIVPRRVEGGQNGRVWDIHSKWSGNDGRVEGRERVQSHRSRGNRPTRYYGARATVSLRLIQFYLNWKEILNLRRFLN